MSTTTSGYLGLDVERAQLLARITAGWHDRLESVLGDLAAAERVLGYAVGVSAPLEQVALDGRAISAALIRAVQVARTEVLTTTPRVALLLDLPVGVTVNRELATAALASGLTYRQAAIAREVRAHALRNPEHRDRIDRLLAEFETIDPDHAGDVGGTHTTEIRERYHPLLHGSMLDLGRAIVTHALVDTVDRSQIRPDEFQVILHDNDTITLVLPGVIDLSTPGLGFDDRNDSVRDLDRVALPSFFSTDLADNRYGVLVREWFAEGVATGVISPGAQVLIVGHSFGAKTALDLASDPDFNGGLVDVTHVVAAGYHVSSHLGHVVNGTKVGVMQSSFDLVVQVERFGHTAIDNSFFGAGQGFGLVAGTAHVGGSLRSRVAPHGVVGFVADFGGGLGGFGHHPDRYVEFLEEDDPDPLIVGFLTDVASSGFGGPGASIAVDVSIRRRPPWNGPAPTPNPGPGRSTPGPRGAAVPTTQPAAPAAAKPGRTPVPEPGGPAPG